MNKKVLAQIKFGMAAVLDEREYKIADNYILQNDLNSLRVFIAEQYDLLDAMLQLDRYNVGLQQRVTLCDQLEDVILDAFLGEIVKV